MKRFKTVVLLLLVCLASASLWAVGQDADKAKTEEKMKITLIAWNWRGLPTEENTRVEQWMEDYFNVELEPWVGVDTYQGEQINVRIASGDIPDFWGMPSSSAMALRDMGAIREVSVSALKKYMPKYLQQCEDVSNEDFWNNSLMPDDGKNWGIPTALSIAAAGPCLAIRKDWIDAVGWTKEIDTLAELEELLTKFVTEDPDGNGKDDTFGLTNYKNSASLDVSTFGYLFGAFGVRIRTWERHGERLEYSMVKSSYRDALKALHRWYEKSIIHPEYPISKRTEHSALISNNKVGAFDNWSSWLSNVGGPWWQTKERDGFEVVYVVSPSGPDGTRGNYSRPAGPWGNPGVFGVDVTDNKMIKILQILEEIYSNPDVYGVMYWGFEGENYTWNEDGTINKIGDTSKEANQSRGTGYFRVGSVLPLTEAIYMGPNRYPVHDWIRQNEVALDYGFAPVFDEDQNVKQTDIRDYETEFYYNVMTGKVNIDAEWDNYVKRMNDLGLRELLEAATSQYLKRK